MQQLLRDFKYLDEHKELNFDAAVEEDEVQHNEEKVVRSKECVNNPHKLKSNYFKKQLLRMSKEDDDMSEVMAMVTSHPTYKSVEEPIDEHRLCTKRGYMEKIAAKHQKKQGESVNSKRAKITKQVRDIGDIGLI